MNAVRGATASVAATTGTATDPSDAFRREIDGVFVRPAIENRFERKFEVVFLRKKLHNLHGFYIFACILLQTASGMGYVERRQTERDEINA